MELVPKGRPEDRPPKARRRFTIRDEAGIPIGHGRTPDEAMRETTRRLGKQANPAFLEERDREYPYRVWCRVPIG